MTTPTTETGQCPKCDQPWKRTVETISGNVYTSYDTGCTCPRLQISPEDMVGRSVAEVCPTCPTCDKLATELTTLKTEYAGYRSTHALSTEFINKEIDARDEIEHKLVDELDVLRELVRLPCIAENDVKSPECLWCCRDPDWDKHEALHDTDCPWLKWKETYQP